MDTNHEWARSPGERWHCRHCPATTWTPMPGECPGREPVMPVSEVLELLEGLRERIGASANAAADQCNYYDDGRCDAHRADADLLTEALLTMEPPMPTDTLADNS